MVAPANGWHPTTAHWKPLLKSATPLRTVCFGTLTVQIRAAWLRGANFWSNFTKQPLQKCTQTHTNTHTHTRTQTHSQTTRHDKKSQDFLGRPYTFTLAPQHVHLTNRSVQSSPTKAQHAMNIEIFWWTQGKGTRTTSRTQVHLLATLTSRKVWWKCIRKECLQCMAVKTISNHAFNLNNTLLRKVCPDICPTTLPCAWVYHKACPVAAIKLVLLVLMPDMTWIHWQAFM